MMDVMSNLIGMILVCFIFFSIFISPLWIFFNYLGKVRSSQNLSREEERMLEDLWKTAQKMDGRVKNLETILNDKTSTKGVSYEK